MGNVHKVSGSCKFYSQVTNLKKSVLNGNTDTTFTTVLQTATLFCTSLTTLFEGGVDFITVTRDGRLVEHLHREVWRADARLAGLLR